MDETTFIKGQQKEATPLPCQTKSQNPKRQPGCISAVILDQQDPALPVQLGGGILSIGRIRDSRRAERLPSCPDCGSGNRKILANKLRAVFQINVWHYKPLLNNIFHPSIIQALFQPYEGGLYVLRTLEMVRDRTCPIFNQYYFYLNRNPGQPVPAVRPAAQFTVGSSGSSARSLSSGSSDPRMVRQRAMPSADPMASLSTGETNQVLCFISSSSWPSPQPA